LPRAPFGGPARHTARKIVSVDRSDCTATRRAANVVDSPPAMDWNVDMAHWLLTAFLDNRRAVDMGEGQRGVKGLGGCAIANPRPKRSWVAMIASACPSPPPG
jgi:hypothetical protein